MKKQYIMPQTEVVEIERTLLFSGSITDPASEPAHAQEFFIDDLEQ